MPEKRNSQQFVNWFRHSSPYINAFRGKTFVVAFGGEAVLDETFSGLIHDLALLGSLGVRLVVVHGARPQIENCLTEHDAQLRYVNGLRVTDEVALDCVKQASSVVRLEIEALLSMGLANSPMAGSRIRVASGNMVVAQPLGVRDGVDYRYTGEVRRIDVEAITHHLNSGAIVLLPPLGYSPTGEIFNLSALEVASATAIALKADKLIFLVEERGLLDGRKKLLAQLDLAEAQHLLAARRKLPEELTRTLQTGVSACRGGVRRTHIISRHVDGALLLELFTRDGIGTLIAGDIYEGIRQATIDDIGGILALITPLEDDGVLVRRSRELLENEIANFSVVERDGTIIACAALYPFIDEHAAELACLAVHPEYRRCGYGNRLMNTLERKARLQRIGQIFLLTTHTAHWFRERGFGSSKLEALPVKRQTLYNYQRGSKILVKDL
ncbi:MAG: amino-acid N-acetyltransferase [Gammaproteobacteria bacterium]|nr:MAG: amino-acid N-acetyltransferase [Gammaproteobacteria bacterium]TND03445.1 MAG: amino-acid N-acetyltransferase [Gammaproteobacteria bacterium]